MSGLDRMRQRLSHYGETNDDRINDSKLRSMLSATNNSYQAEWIDFNDQKCRCLINPSGLTQDYDQKMISIDFKYGLNLGDVFYWIRDDSHWITYLKERTEEAYFRAQIRKCNFEVDINGIKYWVYLRGPNEETLDWELDHKISYNELNYSLVMYIQKNDNTMTIDRFFRVKINGNNYQVAATDKFSMDAIIQVYLAEDFNNTIEDKKKDEDIIKEETKRQENEQAAQEMYPDASLAANIKIVGPTSVTAYDTGVEWAAEGLDETKTYTWSTSSKNAQIVSFDKNKVVIDILFKKANTFTLMLLENGNKIKELQVIVKSV